jgi:hypothetical protein
VSRLQGTGGASIKKLALSRQKYSVGGGIPIRETNLRQGLTIPPRTLLLRGKRQKRKDLSGEAKKKEQGRGGTFSV